MLSLRRLGLDLDTIRSLLVDDKVDLTEILVLQAERISSKIAELDGLHSRLQGLARQAPGSERTEHSIDLLKEISMRIVLSSIYTRTGDAGTTAIGGNTRIEKVDRRLEAIGDVDELVSALGMALAAGLSDQTMSVRSIQNGLFDLGADLAAADAAAPKRITIQHVTALEDLCDSVNSQLEQPRSFVLPGSD